MFVVFLFLVFGLACSASEEKSEQAGSIYTQISFPAFAKAWQDVAKSQEKLLKLFKAIADRSGNEREQNEGPLYTTVDPNDATEGPLYTTVDPDDATEGPLYTTVDPDDATEGPLYTTVDPDDATEGPLYTTVDPDDATEGPLYTTVNPDETTEGPLYTTVDPDETTEEGIFYTVEPNQFAEMPTNDQNEFQHRAGTSFDETTVIPVDSTEHSTKPGEEVMDGVSCDQKSLLRSIRGTPGLHFPNYHDIPVTSFSCADKEVPGFYADLETGCQVFHVCWPRRIESLLCPVGTTFNQAIVACDYWYSTNCSWDILIKSTKTEMPLDITLENAQVSESSLQDLGDVTDVSCVVKFLPVKSKVIHYSTQEGFEVKKPHLMELKSKASDMDKVDIASEIIKEIQKSAQTAVKEVEEWIPRIVSKFENLSNKPLLMKHSKKQIQPESVSAIDPRLVAKQTSSLKVQEQKDSVMPSKPIAREGIPLRNTIFESLPKHLDKDKEAVSEIVMQALEAAGSLLQEDILPATRRIIVDNLFVASKNRN